MKHLDRSTSITNWLFNPVLEQECYEWNTRPCSLEDETDLW